MLRSSCLQRYQVAAAPFALGFLRSSAITNCKPLLSIFSSPNFSKPRRHFRCSKCSKSTTPTQKDSNTVFELATPRSTRNSSPKALPPTSKGDTSRTGKTRQQADLEVPQKLSRPGSLTPREPYKPHQKEPWQVQKRALGEKFGEQGWTPRKRLSPDALGGIRDLNAQDPITYSSQTLADQFKISPEAIRRILKSKWTPNESQQEDRRHRWEKRGEGIWTQMAEIGVKPPKKWRERGIGHMRETGRSRNDGVQVHGAASTTVELTHKSPISQAQSLHDKSISNRIL